MEFPSPLPFADEWTVADRPMLRQLARLDEDYTNALLVLVDSRAARIYEVVLGGFLAETEFASEVPGRHKQGGWAQARYQRHVQEHIDRHYKEVAAYIASYMTAHRIRSSSSVATTTSSQVFAIGWPRPCKPRSWRRYRSTCMTITTVFWRWPGHSPRQQREEELATVQLLVNRAGHGGLAVLGLQVTVEAVNTARVHKLVMQKDFTILGGAVAPVVSSLRDPSPVCAAWR